MLRVDWHALPVTRESMEKRVVVVGGGAAGFFAAITCAQKAAAEPASTSVLLLEKGRDYLSKVRISGGGRCNVTNACFDVRELVSSYPRGSRALIGPFHRFQPRDTITWFEERGVPLKTESDGRVFPITDSSQTVIDCLVNEAERAGVHLRSNCGVTHLEKRSDGFELALASGEKTSCDRVLLATGGCKAMPALATSLGHSLEPPVSSLFTFHIDEPWMRDLAGVSVGQVEAAVSIFKLRETGPLLFTHWGVSGPVILRLSAWGARELSQTKYEFPLRVRWLPSHSHESLRSIFQIQREATPGSLIVSTPIEKLPIRLWEKLALSAGIPREMRWAILTREAQRNLIERLLNSVFHVSGKSPNKSEFVTCGGIPLKEVDFRTMESRICPGLYFAGELLDIDGITGGFNFQAAWTTGWIAGQSM
jgi:predicted Rossmann fold flavoprotein